MKIKTKLTFGVGLLFFLILLLASVSGWFVNQLKNDTNNILTANYNTLLYSRSMLSSLDNLGENPQRAFEDFQKSMQLQFKNITEVGEKELTKDLSEDFSKLKENPDDRATETQVRKDINQIMQLNMQAIYHKSDTANATAQKSIIFISITAIICFVTAFILLINLPQNIAKPITELTESIKEIANQNYKKKSVFQRAIRIRRIGTILQHNGRKNRGIFRQQIG